MANGDKIPDVIKDTVTYHIAHIDALFENPKITILVRLPDQGPNVEFSLSNDSYRDVLESLARLEADRQRGVASGNA